MKTLKVSLCMVALFGGAAFAAGPTAVTAEQRTKMAEVHDKMAACLRSERPLTDCHEEMKKSSQGMDAAQLCPMGRMKHHQGEMMGPE